MDVIAEVLAALKIAQQAYEAAARMYASIQAKGDPTPAEVTDQIAAAKKANDDFHALLGG